MEHSRSGNRIRLVLADDHPFVLMGLKLVFDQPDFDVVDTCDDGARVLETLRRKEPDVLILDVEMPNMHGLDVLREIGNANLPTRVIVLTASPRMPDITAAARLGARGVLGKSEPPDRLLQCVREVHGGASWLELPTEAPLKEDAAAKLSEILTPREAQIVELIGEALPNKAVASKLGITEGTVKVHLHNIYEKLKVRGRMDLLLHVARTK